MSEKPILFSAPMVRKILSGEKTQTRRVVKQEVRHVGLPVGVLQIEGEPTPRITYGNVISTIACPYGKVGDYLWVRESWSPPWAFGDMKPRDMPLHPDIVHYWADGDPEYGDWTKGKPSIHMPRCASRIQLEITDIRVERVQDISEDDAIAEGIHEYECIVDVQNYGRGPVEITGTRYSAFDYGKGDSYEDAAQAFTHLWKSINGAESWDKNPWVWVVEFKRVKP